MNEDEMVQQTTADYMKKKLHWESVYAHNQETFGPDGLLGRTSDTEVVLVRYLRQKLEEFNPGFPVEAYDDAIRQIVEYSSTQTLLSINREKYSFIRDGILVTFRNKKGNIKKERLRLMNFDNPEKNHFLCVRELWIKGSLYRRRADIVGFVNGIPLLFVELKMVHKDLKNAYEQNLSDYKDTIPHIFHHNAIIILGNGIDAKLGTITSKYDYFKEWKRLSEKEPGVVDMETLLKGVCEQNNFIDVIENFIAFDDSTGSTRKILAQNHQFLGVNQSIDAVIDRKKRKGKLGVFWHTQGSGKSYSMVFFTRKIHRKLGGNFTFLICTDREDLDSQIYNTFAGCGVVDNDKDPCRASSGDNLLSLFKQHKAYIFTLIQKFNKDLHLKGKYTERDDVIVICDESHRTQYGLFALNMRTGLPHASFIGFTGTPLFKDDQLTKRIFGKYVSTYDFQRAVDDNATVPLYYDPRGDKLGISIGNLNEKIAEKIDEIENTDIDVQQRMEKELKREYHILTAEKRLDQMAKDFVDHYSRQWENGKAMFICIDKITCVRVYNLIEKYWKEKIDELEKELPKTKDEQEEGFKERQIAWMKETITAVVVSEEQGEVEKFKKWNLDITKHRKLIKEGFEFKGERIDLDSAFKKEEHHFRISIVCAMWLTGFDVPSLSTLYLDKSLKAHTLMQAIARANRVNEGKNNGLIVDYCGILKHLRKALATFAGKADKGHGGDAKDGETDPTRPQEELLKSLKDSISLVKKFLKEKSASLDEIINKTGFEKNAAFLRAKEAANTNDEYRKRFEVMCREVFKRFKSCINIPEVNNYRQEYYALNIIYKSLQNDRENANISSIIKRLHEVVDEAITTKSEPSTEDKQFDISKIDFEKLRQEFQSSPSKCSVVQNLKHVIDKRVHRLLEKNPMRIDFQEHFTDIVNEYNQEKDRAVIEKTFQELIKFVKSLDEEEHRAVREGLDEESLAIFDLLKKSELDPNEIKKIKKISINLLKKIKSDVLKVDHWQDKESTRDSVRNVIHDFLFEDRTGLPIKFYNQDDVKNKAEKVYRHVYRVYPRIPSPYYQQGTVIV
jgi:type I restriction enzyme R subunit